MFCLLLPCSSFYIFRLRSLLSLAFFLSSVPPHFYYPLLISRSGFWSFPPSSRFISYILLSQPPPASLIPPSIHFVLVLVLSSSFLLLLLWHRSIIKVIIFIYISIQCSPPFSLLSLTCSSPSPESPYSITWLRKVHLSITLMFPHVFPR